MSTDQDTLPADRLADLLRQQIESARRSDMRALECLTQQAGEAVHALANHAGHDPMNDAERERLTALYRELTLVLAGAKDKTNRQIRQMSSVRKTLDAYRLHG